MKFEDSLGEVHITALEGLGASYRMSGYFKLKLEKLSRINFKGVAFGGHYGGHNVNISISPAAKKSLLSHSEFGGDEGKLDELLSEVQRRILNGEMTVDFDSIKKEDENVDGLGNIIS